VNADMPMEGVGRPGRASLERLPPGLRAFGSRRFRTLVAASLWLALSLALGSVLARQAADPAGQYAFDFATYHAAAVDLAAGRSPYAAVMFEGPIPAQGPVGASLYKYPPPLAQLLVPLATLPLHAAAVVWLVMQAAMLVASVFVAAVAGGARRNLETLCWCGAAAALFLPAFDTLWKGNVSGLLALCAGVALAGGAAAGTASAAAALAKTTPLVMLAPVLVARGRSLRGALALVPLVGLSIVLAPAAWLDFLRALPNLIAGPADYPTNLALDSVMASLLPGSPLAASAARAVSLMGGLAAMVLAIVAARRPETWPLAVSAAVAAMLLIPSATWYHYLAVVLPVAAFAWPRAGLRARVAMLAGAALVTLALVWLPLAVAGAATTMGAAMAVMAPRMPPVGRGAAWQRIRARAANSALRQRALFWLSCAGYALGLAALVILGHPSRDVPDASAYYQAGQAVLAGRPLYEAIELNAWGAYFYAPVFAQLWAPAALLPELAFIWLWRLLAFASLAWLAGSWRNVGLWLLFPLTIYELANPNVTLPVAAATVAALRGRPWLLPAAGLLKFGPLLLAPYLWITRPSLRRPLVAAGLLTIAACTLSVALSPADWLAYADHLTRQGGASTAGLPNLVALLPSASADFALRLGLGLAVVGGALVLRSDRLAFIAATIAVPTLWVTRLVPLLALHRLPGSRRPIAELRRAGSHTTSPAAANG
jgi:hypothetical protein